MIKIDLKELEIKILWKRLVSIMWMCLALINLIFYYSFEKYIFSFLCILSISTSIFYLIEYTYHKLVKFIYLLYREER